jgi:hypothetical protein
LRRLLLLAALIGAFVPVGAVSAVQPPSPAGGAGSGQLGIRLLEAPENRRDDPRARIYIVDHLNQGDSISRRVEISNSTGTSADIAVYAASARVEAGSFTFGEGRAANELTGWTTVTPSSLTIPAGRTAVAEVAVAIPPDAVDGERYAVVWAEQASAPGGGAISTVSRVGIRMYVSVGEGAEPVSDFAVDQLTAKRNADGAPVVLAQVKNTGQRALDMSGKLQLTNGPGGLNAGPFDATLGTTLGIDQAQPVEIVLDPALPAGPWTARITLSSGELERAVEGSITFPEGTAEVSVSSGRRPQRRRGQGRLAAPGYRRGRSAGSCRWVAALAVLAPSPPGRR